MMGDEIFTGSASRTPSFAMRILASLFVIFFIFGIILFYSFCCIDFAIYSKQQKDIRERQRFSFYIKDTGKTNVTFEEWKATRK